MVDVIARDPVEPAVVRIAVEPPEARIAEVGDVWAELVPEHAKEGEYEVAVPSVVGDELLRPEIGLLLEKSAQDEERIAHRSGDDDRMEARDLIAAVVVVGDASSNVEVLLVWLGGDPRAGVVDLDDGSARGVRPGDDSDRMTIVAAVRNGLRCVDEKAEIDENMTKASLVGHDRRDCPILLLEAGAVADLARCHVDGQIQDVPDVDGRATVLLDARERLQITHDPPDAFRAFACLVDHLDPRLRAAHRQLARGLTHIIEEHVQVGGDGCQRIVDLVRDASRERANRGHAIGGEELALHLLRLGEVAKERDPRCLALIGTVASANFDRERGAVLAQPHVLLSIPRQRRRSRKGSTRR